VQRCNRAGCASSPRRAGRAVELAGIRRLEQLPCVSSPVRRRRPGAELRSAMEPGRIVITGSGAICGAGRTPADILQAIVDGRSSIAPISQWNPNAWPVRIAAEGTDYNAGALTGARKLLKFIRRTDVFGLYAADRALDEASLPAWRDSLEGDAATAFADSTGVLVGRGGGTPREHR